MLEKFDHIKNIGRFYDVPIRNASDGSDNFKKFNLIYADNGTGKSTISTILKSLWRKSPQLLTEKRTINGTGEGFVSLWISGKKYIFTNEKWNKEPDVAFEVFDEEFVAKNVFSPSGVEAENRRELFNYIVLGEENVDKIQEVTERNDLIKGDLKNQIETAERYLERMAGITDIAILDAAVILGDGVPETLSAQVEQNDINIKGAEHILQMSLLDKIPDFERILYTDSISNGLSDLPLAPEYQAHIHTHNTWLDQGTGLVRDSDGKSCPFCLQNIEGSLVIETYKTVFSEAYRVLHTSVEGHLASVERIYGDAAISNKMGVIGRNNELCTFWRRYNEGIPEALLSDSRLEGSIKTFKIALQNLLKRKKNNLLTAIAPNQNEAQGLGQEGWFIQEITRYNNTVNTINGIIQAIKNSVQNLDELKRRNALDRTRLNCHNVRFCNPETIQIYETLKGNRAQKKDSEARIKTLQSEIAQESLNILQQYETGINQELKNFGANFSIKGVRRKSDVTRREGVHFKIRLRDLTFDPSGSVDSPYKLSNTLSSGDKSVLAFAFFIAKFRNKDISNHILVFDDPITSLDFFRKTETTGVIKQFFNRGAQVIVLTHSINFAKLFKSIPHKASHFAWITTNGSGSGLSYTRYDKLSDMNLDKHSHDYHLIQQYIINPASVNRINVIRSIRPYVETKLIKYRDDFAGLSLGRMIARLRDEGMTCEDYITNLGNINDAVVPESHGSDDINADDRENITPEALMNFCIKAINLTAPHPPRTVSIATE